MAKLEVKKIHDGGDHNHVQILLDGVPLKTARKVSFVFEAQNLPKAVIELYPTEVIIDPELSLGVEQKVIEDSEQPYSKFPGPGVFAMPTVKDGEGKDGNNT